MFSQNKEKKNYLQVSAKILEDLNLNTSVQRK